MKPSLKRNYTRCKYRVYLDVKTCEVFLCFLAIIFLGSIVLTSQWLLCIHCFTREFHRFLHEDELVFIGRVYRIDPTKTYIFNAPTLVSSASHKITAKCGILCLKTAFLTEKQLHLIHVFAATCNFFPLAIP